QGLLLHSIRRGRSYGPTDWSSKQPHVEFEERP
ncbi:MAG: hypothetical protein ACI81L_001840, partial [Verrucomicrobiales bacterium]